MCLPCLSPYRLSEMGVLVEFGHYRAAHTGVLVEFGQPVASVWEPAGVWSGDLWTCRECGVQVVLNFGLEPVIAAGRRDYGAAVMGLRLLGRVPAP